MTRVLYRFVLLLTLAASIVLAPRTWASEPTVAQEAALAAGFKAQENLRQLMLGIFFPASNVVFAAQDDLKNFPEAEDAAVSPNPLTSIYGGWEAVENAALALSEASNLLLISGRLCSNGQPVPLQRPDWPTLVQVMRDAAAAAYKAAQSESQEAMVNVSDTLTQACAGCHNVYRDKNSTAGGKNVCLP